MFSSVEGNRDSVKDSTISDVVVVVGRVRVGVGEGMYVDEWMEVDEETVWPQ